MKYSTTDVEAFAEELRKLKLNDLSLMHEAMFADIVKRLLSDIRGRLAGTHEDPRALLRVPRRCCPRGAQRGKPKLDPQRHLGRG